MKALDCSYLYRRLNQINRILEETNNHPISTADKIPLRYERVLQFMADVHMKLLWYLLMPDRRYPKLLNTQMFDSLEQVKNTIETTRIDLRRTIIRTHPDLLENVSKEKEPERMRLLRVATIRLTEIVDTLCDEDNII
jgi:hypothetical protein